VPRAIGNDKLLGIHARAADGLQLSHAQRGATPLWRPQRTSAGLTVEEQLRSLSVPDRDLAMYPAALAHAARRQLRGRRRCAEPARVAADRQASAGPPAAAADGG
jgi:hypothetical protein